MAEDRPAGVPDEFLTLSAALTGFDAASLWGSGCAPLYHRQLREVAGALTARLLATGAAAAGDDDAMRREVMADPDLGPLARSLIHLWYLGAWVPMPEAWVARNGAAVADSARILSPLAYREGLAWTAMGAHPLGAKPQGYGAWAFPPPPDESAAGRRAR